MYPSLMICAAAFLAALLFSLPGLAQNLDFDVLADTGRSTATGCSVTPSGGTALAGFEHRVRTMVDLATALKKPSCAGVSFGAPVSVVAPTNRVTAS